MSAQELFFEMLAVERGSGHKTLEAYKSDLKAFTDFLATHGKTPEKAGKSDLRAYLAELHQQGFRDSSQARKLSALRQFYRFLVEEEFREDNPCEGLESPRRSRVLPKYLSEGEVKVLLEGCERLVGNARTVAEKAESLRQRALVELLYATGLRASELVTLRLAAMKEDPRFLRVVGKGNKERLVPLYERARLALSDYLEIRPYFLLPGADSPYLFPSRGKLGHLTRQRLAQMLKGLADEVGMPPERLSAHVFRHAFASHLLAHGGDLRALQVLLGHANISTTEIYTHVERQALKSLVESKHPLGERT